MTFKINFFLKDFTKKIIKNYKKFLNSDFCVCGNTFAKPNSNSSSICNHGCSGNQTEECGGYGNGNDYYSIYATVAGMWNVTFYLTY